jgi:hypothetical protein
MNSWPSSHAYTIAVQNPHVCFRDPELRAGHVERTAATRMPRVWTGNFAQVYEVRGASGRRWAVKCFTRSVVDVRGRYSEIAAAIKRSRLPYFVEFDLLDGEMLVDGARYPVLKMQWADGLRLDRFVEANLYRPRALLSTAAALVKMVRDLERRKIAHGDLQHGNIVITGSGLNLVDYDGLFVPRFAGEPAPEAGLACYQHPRRSPSDYGVGLDRFSLLAMCTALAALAAEPSLWGAFNSGANLLFTTDDFAAPAASRLIERIGALADPQARALLQTLLAACERAPMDVPLPDGAIALKPTARHRFWWARDAAPADPAAGNSSPRTSLLQRQYRIRLNMPTWNAQRATRVAFAVRDFVRTLRLWM